MGYQPIERLLPQAGGSVYRLVRMAANRAMEIAEGKPKLIKKYSSDKETTIALEEIMHGKIIAKESAEKKSSKGKNT